MVKWYLADLEHDEFLAGALELEADETYSANQARLFKFAAKRIRELANFADMTEIALREIGVLRGTPTPVAGHSDSAA